jgi:hypothetical protein
MLHWVVPCKYEKSLLSSSRAQYKLQAAGGIKSVVGTERATWQTRGSDVTESGFMTLSRHGYLLPLDPRLRLKYTVSRQLSTVIV